MGPCATVRVKADVTEDNPNGYILINESDFTPEEYELYEEKPAEAAPVENQEDGKKSSKK